MESWGALMGANGWVEIANVQKIWKTPILYWPSFSTLGTKPLFHVFVKYIWFDIVFEWLWGCFNLHFCIYFTKQKYTSLYISILYQHAIITSFHGIQLFSYPSTSTLYIHCWFGHLVTGQSFDSSFEACELVSKDAKLFTLKVVFKSSITYLLTTTF